MIPKSEAHSRKKRGQIIPRRRDSLSLCLCLLVFLSPDPQLQAPILTQLSLDSHPSSISFMSYSVSPLSISKPSGSFLFVQAARKQIKPRPYRNRKKGEKIRDDQFDEFFTIIKWTYTLAIIPIVLYFVYNLIMDPDLPVILKQLIKITRLKWLSYLGKKEKLMEEGTGGALLENNDFGTGKKGSEDGGKSNYSGFEDNRNRIKDSREEINKVVAAGGDVVSFSADRTKGLRKRGGSNHNEQFSHHPQTDGFFGKTLQVHESKEQLKKTNNWTMNDEEPGQSRFNYTYKYANEMAASTNENKSPNERNQYQTSSQTLNNSMDPIAYENSNVLPSGRTKKIRKKSSLALGETTALEYESNLNNSTFASTHFEKYGNQDNEMSTEERLHKENTNRAIFKTFLANTLKAEQLKYNTVQQKQL